MNQFIKFIKRLSINYPYIKNKLFWFVLIFGHLIVMAGLYVKFGFNISNESDKYLTEANYIIDGNFIKAFGHQLFYGTYLLYLSFFLFFKLPVVVVFISTYCLSLIAYACFYKLLQELISEPVAKIWLICMLLNPFIQYWQFNLFSETFFIALSLLFTYFLFKKVINKRLLKIGLMSFFVIFCRPAGIFTVAFFLVVFFFKNKSLNKKIIIASSMLFAKLLFSGIIFYLPLHYQGFSYQLCSGSIYCGFPTFSEAILPRGSYTLWDCYYAIYSQYGLDTVLNLFCKKFVSFFSTTRSYYTLFHNILNASQYIFYALGIIGIYISIKTKSAYVEFFLAIFGIIFLNALMVGLFFNEWSERYTLVVFPFIFVIASVGIHYSFNYFSKKIAI